MTPSLKVSSGAHIGTPTTVTHIMWQVMLALTPATVFGVYSFGWPALNLFIIAEWHIANERMKKRNSGA